MLDFNLSQTELLCLAVIFGFSQDGESKFTGSASYLAKWCMVKNKKTIYDALKRLTDRKLIIKYERYEHDVRLCDYAFNFDVLSNTGVVQNSDRGSVNFTPPPSVNFTPHNIDIDNIEDNKEEKILKKEEIAEEIYQLYPRKLSKKEAIRSIVKALSSYSPEFLKEKTKLYAKLSAWKGKDYIPYPSTWFNHERFNDNPEEWKDHSGNKGAMSLSENGLKVSQMISQKASMARPKSDLEDELPM